jgi:hypothetical protein
MSRTYIISNYDYYEENMKYYNCNYNIRVSDVFAKSIGSFPIKSLIAKSLKYFIKKNYTLWVY